MYVIISLGSHSELQVSQQNHNRKKKQSVNQTNKQTKTNKKTQKPLSPPNQNNIPPKTNRKITKTKKAPRQSPFALTKKTYDIDIITAKKTDYIFCKHAKEFLYLSSFFLFYF